MAERTKWLVSTEWLESHLKSPDVVVLDGSWYLPHMERDAIAEYEKTHIPGALFFDIDQIADLSSDLPHMLPSAVQFSSAMRKMGIGDGQRIVIYDGMGLFSAARVWWTLRTMGVTDVYILDGGLPKWLEEGRPVDDVVPIPGQRHFSARLDHGAVRDFRDVLKAVDDNSIQIIDARPRERWQGLAAEPRPNLQSGRIPGSLNVPFMELLDDKGRLKDLDEIKEQFEKAGVDLGKPIITSCGSGATAAILCFALDSLGHSKHALYDGSWADWGAREDSPVERDA